jgi:hypothetical protein
MDERIQIRAIHRHGNLVRALGIGAGGIRRQQDLERVEAPVLVQIGGEDDMVGEVRAGGACSRRFSGPLRPLPVERSAVTQADAPRPFAGCEQVLEVARPIALRIPEEAPVSDVAVRPAGIGVDAGREAEPSAAAAENAPMFLIFPGRRTIGLLHRLQPSLSRPPLLAVTRLRPPAVQHCRQGRKLAERGRPGIFEREIRRPLHDVNRVRPLHCRLGRGLGLEEPDEQGGGAAHGLTLSQPDRIGQSGSAAAVDSPQPPF